MLSSPRGLTFLLSHLLLGNEAHSKTHGHDYTALLPLLKISFLVLDDVMHDSMAKDEAF